MSEKKPKLPTEDDVLRRMLQTPPKKHAPSPPRKAAKKK